MDEPKHSLRDGRISLSDTDTRGLVCAFRLGAVAPCEHEVLARQLQSDPHWLHFNLNDRRTRHFLEREVTFPEGALELFLDPQPRIRIHLLGECIVAVLSDLQHDLQRGAREEFGIMRIYIDRERVISARNQPLESLDALRRELRHGRRIEAPFGLFERLLHCMSDTFTGVLAELTTRVDSAEDEVLAGRVSDQATALGRTRRRLAQLRRQLHADRSALAMLRGKLPSWTGVTDLGSLYEAIEHLDGSVHDVELLQERTRLLGDEVSGRLNEATNRHLYLLSIVTTVLLPVTLITGVFGMNVGGLPWIDSPRGFAWVSAVMLVALLISVFLVKRRV
jgi:zinc transporter